MRETVGAFDKAVEGALVKGRPEQGKTGSWLPGQLGFAPEQCHYQ